MDATRLGYDKTGSPLTSGYEPQWHHIYPPNLLRAAGVPDDDIHALANITVLNERTNVKKREPHGFPVYQSLRGNACGCRRRNLLIGDSSSVKRRGT
ncbi:MAG: hypothetical protein AB1609_18360 [Bacillota bacterium]